MLSYKVQIGSNYNDTAIRKNEPRIRIHCTLRHNSWRLQKTALSNMAHLILKYNKNGFELSVSNSVEVEAILVIRRAAIRLQGEPVFYWSPDYDLTNFHPETASMPFRGIAK